MDVLQDKFLEMRLLGQRVYVFMFLFKLVQPLPRGCVGLVFHQQLREEPAFPQPYQQSVIKLFIVNNLIGEKNTISV